MTRPLRIEYPGAFYHVTARGNEQKDIFNNLSDREKFLSYLEMATERYGAVVHAYCLMNNHYHLMLETPQGNLSRIMGHINSSYSTYYNTRWKRAGHLLQGRYKAILVEADVYATALSCYIHLNPVRAGMVAVPEDYPWTSYRYYSNEIAPQWLTTDFILGYFGRDAAAALMNYRQFVHALIKQEYSNPLRDTVASSILGSDDFIGAIQARHLCGQSRQRDLPALRELDVRPSLQEIIETVNQAFTEQRRQARKASIYLCHRYSGARLKEIGRLFQLSESGVSRASRRFGEAMAGDGMLETKMMEIRDRLKLSIA